LLIDYTTVPAGTETRTEVKQINRMWLSQKGTWKWGKYDFV